MFVFPMAGLSRRFSEAGYVLPKYMLKADNKTIFRHVLNGFSAYFDQEPFMFICRDVANTPDFIQHECAALGITSPHIVVLDAPTRGQAETVALGLSKVTVAPDEPLTIFNIDTIHAPFHHPSQDVLNKLDGYLEVFRADGNMWSFARTISDTDMTVVETAEKRRISELCSTGLYYFKKAFSFLDAYHNEEIKPQSEWGAGELYVAPLYNTLIHAGLHIKAVEVPTTSITPCGIPQEYVAFCRQLGPDH